MLNVNIPDRLTDKINGYAKQACQTPEEYIIELLEERIDHDCSYKETHYLAKSKVNKQRLDKAVEEIREGKYESYGLIEDD